MALAPALGGALLALLAGHGHALAAPCDSATVARVRAPATSDEPLVKLTCDLALKPDDVITKQLVFEGSKASGTTLACRGATLVGGRDRPRHSSVIIRAKRDREGRYDRPQDITVRDCRIEGGVRIHGMGDGGRDRPARDSSYRRGHTARSRAAGPTRIHLERLHLQAVGPIPLYIAQGVTHVRFVDSLITGERRSVAIYLDAESGHNTIRGNTLLARSERREAIAVDGSSHNLIAQNLFATGTQGGVYLYRNCGERGTVRHNRPTHNRILSNAFVYAPGQWDDPAVFLGSRDGSAGYCDEDDAHGLGSGDSDLDFARDNLVADNVLLHRPLDEAIATRRPRVNGPNYVVGNRTVDSLSPSLRPPLRCRAPSPELQRPVEPGASVAAVVVRGGHPVCRVQRCDDGTLVDDRGCALHEVGVQCLSAPGQTACETRATCPAGMRPLSAMAACDLHGPTPPSGPVRRALVPGTVTVLRAGKGGECRVGHTRVERLHRSLSVAGVDSVPLSCRASAEGSGCAIDATLFCVPSPHPPEAEPM